MSPEEKIGAAVSEWLRRQGWTVYAEVEVPGGKRRADIVAVKGDEVWIVEAKVRLGLRLLRQAVAWTDYAHRVSVAVSPELEDGDSTILSRLGLGLFLAWEGGESHALAPRVAAHPRRAGLVLDALRPEHQASRAGNADGAFHTGHAEQARRLREWVAVRAGVFATSTLADGLRAMTRSTPTREERARWEREIRNGTVPGLRVKREGRRVLLSVDPADPEGGAW